MHQEVSTDKAAQQCHPTFSFISFNEEVGCWEKPYVPIVQEKHSVLKPVQPDQTGPLMTVPISLYYSRVHYA